MNYNFAPLIEKAVAQYKDKVVARCLECPHYPHDCPPKRCPTHTSVRLSVGSSKATLFGMIRAYA